MSSKKRPFDVAELKNKVWEDEDSDLEPHSDELQVSSPEVLETDEHGGINVVEGEPEGEDEAEGGQAVKDDEEEELPSDKEEADRVEANKPAKKRARTSKHAPTSQSAKHTVSRKRTVIPLAKSRARDPRFDPTAGPVNHGQLAKNYAFLDDYVDSEIKTLKTRINEQKPKKIRKDNGEIKMKRRKGVSKLSEDEIESLKRELIRLESKKASKQARDREDDVQREHKQRERDMVGQGKKPFFLKKSEVKKQVLIKRFEGMSQGKRDKTMEKKRRRLASKERRDMPSQRRM